MARKYEKPEEKSENFPNISEETMKEINKPIESVKAEWMELRKDPEIGKYLEVNSYEKATIVLLNRILNELKRK